VLSYTEQALLHYLGQPKLLALLQCSTCYHQLLSLTQLLQALQAASTQQHSW